MYGLKKKPTDNPKVTNAEPDWSLQGLTYTLDDPERNNHEYNYTINFDENEWVMKEVLEQNKTLYAHMQVTTDNPLHLKHP